MSEQQILRQLVGFWLVAIAAGDCADSSEGNRTNPNGVPTSQKVMRAVVGDDGTEFLCEYVEPSSSGPTRCVKKETGEPYLCKVFVGNGVVNYHCLPDTPAVPWVPPCENYKQMGDHKEGRSCWDPPEDYCKDGCGPMMTWFCRPDATKCCWVGCNCYWCGWIEFSSASSCHIAGEALPAPQSFCEEFTVKIPERYRKCIAEPCTTEEIEQITLDPDCDWGPDPGLLICEEP